MPLWHVSARSVDESIPPLASTNPSSLGMTRPMESSRGAGGPPELSEQCVLGIVGIPIAFSTEASLLMHPGDQSARRQLLDYQRHVDVTLEPVAVILDTVFLGLSILPEIDRKLVLVETENCALLRADNNTSVPP